MLAKTPPAPQVIGVDELSIKKGHMYRIVVSDLERGYMRLKILTAFLPRK